MNGRVVEMPIDLRIVADGRRVAARLDYDPDAPVEVRLVFPLDPPEADGTPLQWRFARDLLADVLASGRAGELDVRLWRMGGHVAILLDNTADRELFSIPWAEVRAFLRFTEMLVPIGSEKVDVDAVILGCFTDGGG